VSEELPKLSERLAGLSPEKRALLMAKLRSKAASQSPIRRRAYEEKRCLTAGQRGIWLDQQLNPGVSYNLLLALSWRGDLDRRTLDKAWHSVLERHEVLRARFALEAEEPFQTIVPTGQESLPFHDLRSIPQAERKTECQGLAIAQTRKVFELSEGGLIRGSVVQLEDQLYHLLFTVHHLVFDAWSAGVLADDLLEAYVSSAESRCSQWPELPIRYTDYAEWQRELYQGKEWSRQLDVWRERLSGKIPALDWSTPAVRKASTGHHGAALPFVIDEESLKGLKTLASSLSTTLFNVLLAALECVLARYGGQEEFLVATATHGRSRPETPYLIGYFVNLLLLRADLRDDPSFEELIRRVHDVTTEALSNADIPYELILEEVQKGGAPQLPPVQVQLQLFPADEEPTPRGGVEIERLNADPGVAWTDLDIMISRRKDGLKGLFQFNTEILDQRLVVRLLDSYLRVLTEGLGHPSRRVSELSVLSDPDLHQLLVTCNQTSRPIPAGTLFTHFESRAGQIPDSVALIWQEQSIGFGTVLERARQVAHRMHIKGVRREQVVALGLPLSPDLVISILAAWQLGALYVPFDPAEPLSRIRTIIDLAKPDLLVTRESFSDAFGLPHLSLDEVDRVRVTRTPECPRGDSHEAYLLFTSGGSGTPKGVIGTHRGALNRFAWMWAEMPFEAGEIACAKTSPTFVDSLWELFGPLLAGVPVVLASERERRDPRLLVQLMSRHRVSRLVLVPSLLEALLDSAPNLRASLPELKMVISSGERLRLALARSFQEALPQSKLFNLYGSTEVAGDVTCQRVKPDHSKILIGTPIWNTQLFVLDRSGRIVPRGVIGELWVSGAGLGRYSDESAEEPERFQCHPFTEELNLDVGARIFSTGDLARWTEDGRLEFVRRADRQMKVRGHRVEPLEIEDVIKALDSVLEVFVRWNVRHGVVAYILPAPGHRPTESSLRQHVRLNLPDYMVPKTFELVSEFLRTPSGKIDHSRLPEPRSASDESLGAELNDTLEQRLIQVWEEILCVSSVGPDSDFFSLGGDSLLAVRVVDRLERVVGRRYPASALLRYQTVRELAEKIRAGDEMVAVRPGAILPFQSGGVKRPVFMPPGIAGGTWYWRNFLPHEQPAYGFQHSRGQSIKAMAQKYVEALRAFQTEGPYRLIGYSFSAFVAFEMATQLHEQGQEVDRLILVDTGPGLPSSSAGARLAAILRNLPNWLLYDLLTSSPGQIWYRLLRLLKVCWRQLRASLRGLEVEREASDYLQLELFDAELRPMIRENDRALSRWKPELFLGRIILIRAKAGPLLQGHSHDLGWSRLASEVEVVNVPGTHRNVLLPPYAATVKKSLERILE
jgi:amino acid adenylation domain-containing protein